MYDQIRKSNLQPDLFLLLPIDEILILRDPLIALLSLEALLFLLIINLPQYLRLRINNYLR